MFYTKYRPQQFKDLIGLASTAKVLKKSFAEGKFGHAYFFHGPRGSGKTTTARLMAKALNCLNLGKDGEPDDVCEVCQAIKSGRYLDVIEIDAASNRGIDDIRDLREKVRLAPSQGQYKMYIIDEVHMLTKEAFNALLKTLEEPPQHVVFVLATTEPHKVPQTIRSRCQVFAFKRAGRVDLISALKLICQKEEADVPEADLERIVDASDGGYRDAENLLEQVIVGGLSVRELLGSSDISPLDFVQKLVEGDLRGSFSTISDLFESGASLEAFTQDCLQTLRQILLISSGAGEDLVATTKERYARLSALADKLSAANLNRLLEGFISAEAKLSRAPILQLPLEMLAAEYIGSAPAVVPEVKAEKSEPEASRKLNNEAITQSVEKELGPAMSQEEGTGSGLSLEKVQSCWNAFLEKVRPHNHSLRALLRSARPLECRADNTLVLEMFYKFHQERVQEPKNREILETVLSEVLGTKVKISCVLGEKTVRAKTDTLADTPESGSGYAPSVAGEIDSLAKKALEVFGAGM